MTAICEIGTTVAIFVFGTKFAETLNFGMLDSMEYYDPQYNQTTDLSVITSSWNELQTSMKCCGAYQFTDWRRNSSLNMTNSVPDSCCEEISKDCGSGKLDEKDPNDIYKNGCLVNFFDVVSQEKGGISIVFSIIFSAQIVIAMIACYFGYGLKKGKYELIEETNNIECTEE